MCEGTFYHDALPSSLRRKTEYRCSIRLPQYYNKERKQQRCESKEPVSSVKGMSIDGCSRNSGCGEPKEGSPWRKRLDSEWETYLWGGWGRWLDPQFMAGWMNTLWEDEVLLAVERVYAKIGVNTPSIYQHSYLRVLKLCLRKTCNESDRMLDDFFHLHAKI